MHADYFPPFTTMTPPKPFKAQMRTLVKVAGALFIVTLPPVMALLIAAACYGHGHISYESIVAVAQAIGQTSF
jgi:hypothetical protein